MRSYDWGQLAYGGGKKEIKELRATFVAAPRQMSAVRFKELVKQYLLKGNIVLGLAKEDYVQGFESQPQFRMLDEQTVKSLIDKVNISPSPHKIYTLQYAQRDVKYVFKELSFRRVVLVNGSWKYSFHTQEPYYALVNRGTPYDMVSPFSTETEAMEYEQSIWPEVQLDETMFTKKSYGEADLLAIADLAAKQSFDHTFQTGTVLARKGPGGYEYLLSAFNKVVPYQTYAMHHGASREKNFSPPNDLNHYDAVHAEVELVVKSGKQGVALSGASLFINLLPCPHCARMLSETDIHEIVYSVDHSAGYAVALLEAAGKKVRRIVDRSKV